MSAPAIENPEPGFWSKPSTRLSIFWSALPLVLAFSGFLLGIHSAVQAQAHDIADTKQELAAVRATNAEFQSTKEKRIEQIAVVNTKLEQQAKDIAEIKASQLRLEDKLDRVLQSH